MLRLEPSNGVGSGAPRVVRVLERPRGGEPVRHRAPQHVVQVGARGCDPGVGFENDVTQQGGTH